MMLLAFVQELQIRFPQIDIDAVATSDVVAPELFGFEPDRVEWLWVFALVVRDGVRKYVAPVKRCHDTGFAAHVPGKPGVPGNLEVARAHFGTELEGRLHLRVITIGRHAAAYQPFDHRGAGGRMGCRLAMARL